MFKGVSTVQRSTRQASLLMKAGQSCANYDTLQVTLLYHMFIKLRFSQNSTCKESSSIEKSDRFNFERDEQ